MIVWSKLSAKDVGRGPRGLRASDDKNAVMTTAHNR